MNKAIVVLVLLGFPSLSFAASRSMIPSGSVATIKKAEDGKAYQVVIKTGYSTTSTLTEKKSYSESELPDVQDRVWEINALIQLGASLDVAVDENHRFNLDEIKKNTHFLFNDEGGRELEKSEQAHQLVAILKNHRNSIKALEDKLKSLEASKCPSCVKIGDVPVSGNDCKK